MAFTKTAEKFLKKKYNWSDTTYNKIDWDAHAALFSNNSHIKQKQILKYIHHRQPISQFNPNPAPICPFCKKTNRK